MGFYLVCDVTIGKAKRFIEKHNAEVVACPLSVEQLQTDKALVCVVENLMFDAALYVPDDRELKDTLATKNDRRKRTYLLMDKELVKKLSHYDLFK